MKAFLDAILPVAEITDAQGKVKAGARKRGQLRVAYASMFRVDHTNRDKFIFYAHGSRLETREHVENHITREAPRILVPKLLDQFVQTKKL